MEISGKWKFQKKNSEKFPKKWKSVRNKNSRKKFLKKYNFLKKMNNGLIKENRPESAI